MTAPTTIRAAEVIYVIVPTLNPGAHLPALVTALASTGLPLRIGVIDNGSSDGTRAWCEAQRHDGALTLIGNQTNIGVASAWNLGIQWALAQGSQLVLVCGHDTVPMPGAVLRLAKLAAQGVPLVTGTAVPYDSAEAPCPELAATDPLILAPDFSFFMLNAACIQALLRWDASGASKAPMAPWDLGLFDARYWPAYFEDNDFHYRMQQAGLLAARDPAALFRHDCSLTLRSTPEVAAINAESFRVNGELFRSKWGGLPHEVSAHLPARALNVSDEQWQAMSGGRHVEVQPADQVIQQAMAVYARAGLVARPPAQ